MTRRSAPAPVPMPPAAPHAPRATAAARSAAAGPIATVRSEWCKLWAVPSTVVQVVLAVVLTVVVTFGIAVAGDGEALADMGDGAYGVVFFSSAFGVWTFAGLSGAFVAAEFRTGMVAASLIATPRRWRLLAAKLVVIAALAVPLGAVVALVNFAAVQQALRIAGEQTLPLTTPGLVRALVLFVPVTMLVQGLLTAAVATVARHAGVAIAVVIGVSLLPVALAEFLGAWYREAVPRYVPGAAAESVAGLSTPGSAGYLDTWAAVAVIAAWLAVALAVAFWAFARRDA